MPGKEAIVFPADNRSAMMPEPTTVATKKAVPRTSAVEALQESAEAW
jgi:hypothetical protein